MVEIVFEFNRRQRVTASAGQWRWSLNSDGGQLTDAQIVAARDDVDVGVDDGDTVCIGKSTCRGVIQMVSASWSWSGTRVL